MVHKIKKQVKKYLFSNQSGFSQHLILPVIVVAAVVAIGGYVLTRGHAAPLTTQAPTTRQGAVVISLPDGWVTIGAASPNNALDAALDFTPKAGSTDALNQGSASLKDCPDTTGKNCTFVKYSTVIKNNGGTPPTYSIVTSTISPADVKATDLYAGCGNYNVGWGKYVGYKCEKGEMWHAADFTSVAQQPANANLSNVSVSACKVQTPLGPSPFKIKFRGVRSSSAVSEMGVVFGPDLSSGSNPTVITNQKWVPEYGQTGDVSVTQATIPQLDKYAVWFMVNGQINYWTFNLNLPSNLATCN